MIRLTERAADHLHSRLIEESLDSRAGFRLMPVTDGEFVLFPDLRSPSDYVVEHRGSNVLIVGVEYLEMLADVTVECEETSPEPRFYFTKSEHPSSER